MGAGSNQGPQMNRNIFQGIKRDRADKWTRESESNPLEGPALVFAVVVLLIAVFGPVFRGLV